MKPKVVIKNVKGYKYLQLINIHGSLIHIGNVDDDENWRIAHRALEDQYVTLAMSDFLKLDKERAIKTLDNDRPSESAWDKYCEKEIRSILRREFIFKFADKNYDIVKLEREMDDREIELRTHIEASKITNSSLETMDLIMHNWKPKVAQT